MLQESGDDYIRNLANFVRTNERALAEPAFARRRRPQQQQQQQDYSLANPLSWFSYDPPPVKPVVLSTDIHHLFYVLMRLEALGYDVGTLDVQLDNPSRPTSYINFAGQDKSDTLSLTSFRSSLSAVSNLSLGVGWWSRQKVLDVDLELKYLYSSFTKLPALTITAPSNKVIAETLTDMPTHNALPLDIFKNLQSLDCTDIDPRLLLGWDRLSESLRSLKIRKSGLEDVADIFIGAVVDDQSRRAGSSSRKRRRNIPRQSRQLTLQPNQLPDTVLEVEETTEEATGSFSPPLSIELPSVKWAFLRYLSIADNSLAFLPQDILPYLTSLTHLDLSSNLFVSIPPGLGTLYNLTSLNLSDNMIDSVLGIYLNLGQILQLNLSHNRLESICGLERLQGLERVDLRSNLIEESSEIGRLATLPNIAQIWIEGNPFCEIEDNYRVACFDYFFKERKSVALDGSFPGYYEKKSLTASPPEQMTSTRPISIASSPPIVTVQAPLSATTGINQVAVSSTPPSSNASPALAPVSVSGKPRRKVKRIVDLDGSTVEIGVKSSTHSRIRSGDSREKGSNKSKVKESMLVEPERKWGQLGTVNLDEVSTPKATFMNAECSSQAESAAAELSSRPRLPSRQTTIDLGALSPRRTRHNRYQTEFLPATSIPEDGLAEGGRSRNGGMLGSRSSVRQKRLSASVFEGPMTHSDGEEEVLDNAEEYRRRLEALKKDMGDGWLKIYSQTELKSR